MQNLLKTLSPDFLLTFYNNSEQEKSYLELHKVVNGKILSGKPLTRETLNKMLSLVKPLKERIPCSTALMPTNVLYFNFDSGKRILVWYTKAQKQKMLFTKSLKIKDGVAWQPPLLWVTDHNELNVYVLNSNKRPENKTMLYENKYPNVQSSFGRVCTGSVPLEKSLSVFTIEGIMNFWHHVFWNSKFSHATHLSFWKNQIATGEKYPLEKLKPVTSLENLIREL